MLPLLGLQAALAVVGVACFLEFHRRDRPADEGEADVADSATAGVYDPRFQPDHIRVRWVPQDFQDVGR